MATQKFPGKRELDAAMRDLANDLKSGAVEYFSPPTSRKLRTSVTSDKTKLYPPFGVIQFNMAETLADGTAHNCGTVGCIGGLLAHRMGIDADQFIDRACDKDQRFKKLFYPDGNPDKWDRIQPAEAARQIDIFMKGGVPQYDFTEL